MKLHHVQVAMPPDSEDEAREFYRDALGLSEVEKPSSLPAEGAWFVRGDLELHLGVQEEFVPATKAHPAILVDDLGDITDRLRHVGYEVRPDGRLPGFDRCYTDDPFGNRIELLTPSE